MKKARLKRTPVVNIPAVAVPVSTEALPVVPPKGHPDYFRIIGIRSAAKRKMTSQDFSAMARASHGPNSRRDGYHGGRKRKGQA